MSLLNRVLSRMGRRNRSVLQTSINGVVYEIPEWLNPDC